MKNPYIKFGLILGLIAILILLVETNKKTPINWNTTYSSTNKNPFDLYIFEKETNNLLEDAGLWSVDATPFDFFRDTLYNSDELSNFVSINNFGDFDEETGVYLNKYLNEGNTALLIQDNFSNAFLDKYGIAIRKNYSDDNYSSTIESSLELVNKTLTTQKFITEYTNNNSFVIADSVKNTVEILGYRTPKEGEKGINLIRIKQYAGDLILGVDPIIFTNYYLLKSNNHLYIQDVISYLPSQNTYFHQDKHREIENDTSLKFIFSNASLTWAWYLFIIALILFVFFTAKRKQRIVPIIEPPKNTTVEFTKTVSNLYIETKDYKDLMNKSILYSLEKIRREYWIDTSILDENFCESLALKTDKSIKDIEKFIAFIHAFKQHKITSTEDNLVKLNQLTEKIFD